MDVLPAHVQNPSEHMQQRRAALFLGNDRHVHALTVQILQYMDIKVQPD